MACRSSAGCSELDFVRALHERTINGECKGPGVTLSLLSGRVAHLERIFDSEIASDVLWSGFDLDDDSGPSLRFTLCAAHWFDLGALAWARGYQKSRPEWLCFSQDLLQDLCREVAWDPKEIVNMFSWLRTRLT